MSSWPPLLSLSQIETLIIEANTYALSKSLLYLPIPDPRAQKAQAPTSAIHAPYTLLPTPLPRHLFDLSRKLQRSYNMLYARIASNVEFLDRIMGADVGVGRVDTFTGTLWRGWKEIRDRETKQSLQLGLFRSDYLVHDPVSSNDPPSLKQVEFNTISVSFGALSERVAGLHRHLYETTAYFNASSVLRPENFPPNNSLSGLVAGLAEGHRAYGVAKSYILMVVQPGERNLFDQKLIEYDLWEKHAIRLVRLTFTDIAERMSIDPHTLILTVTHPTSATPLEISVVYFRAGYTPTDYPTPQHFETRFALERSRAIKCPSIPLQLAGGKKVQEELTQPGVLESLLPASTGFSADDLALLRETWVAMWALGTPEGVERARAGSDHLVLKPQREGGGNNVYRGNIPPFFDDLQARGKTGEEEGEAWIAMEMIEPPQGVRNLLVKAGEASAVEGDVISELGIFGWVLFGGEDGEIKDDEAGWLVRTKGRESDEGGVAVGFSVLDSIVLVDDDRHIAN